MVDGVHRFLQMTLQRGHGAHDRRGELAGPAVVDETDRDGVQVVALLAADLRVGHRPAPSRTPRCFMTPNRVIPGRRLAQLAERLAIALEEPVEQRPPIGIAKCPEDRGHVIRHGGDDM